MISKNMKLLTVTLVAIAAILLMSYALLGSAERGDVMIEADVDAEGTDRTITITASLDVFEDGMTGDSMLVYYAVLDSYITDKGFDYAAFMEDLEKEGVWDEELQQFLPFNTVRADIGSVDVLDSRTMTVGFSAEGMYAAYMVAILPGASEGLPSGYLLSVFDVPTDSFQDDSPVMKIVGEVYENVPDQMIRLCVENAEFLDTVSAEDITLLASFSNLEIADVQVIDSNNIILYTLGYVSKGTSGTGIVSVSDGATSSGVLLMASCAIMDHFIRIDLPSLKLGDGILSFNVIVSQDILPELRNIAIGDQFCEVEMDDSGIACAKLKFHVGTDDIEEAIRMIEGKYMMPIDTFGLPLNAPGFPIVIPRAMFDATVESMKVSGSGYDVEAKVTASYGIMADGITPGDIEFEGNFDGVSNVQLIPYSDGYVLKFHVEKLQGSYLCAKILIKSGVLSYWGQPAECATVVLAYGGVPALGDISTDQMIEQLYGHMKFSKIFSGIGYGIQGIELIVNILGATGVIDMRSATDIAVAEINVKCDEIKKMLADQAIMLDNMNKKLDQIVEMLHEQRLLDLSNIYGSYRAALNDLANAIYNYSSAIKSDIWGFAQGDHDGKTFYIYFTTDCKPSVMPGDFFIEHSSGSTIDGKSILPAFTIGVTVEKDVTFSETRTDTKFGVNTEKHMVSDLTRYVQEHIFKDGQTTYDVSNSGVSKSYSAQELAQEIYNCMVAKYTSVEANSSYGENVLNCYYKYTETMASLVVNADGSITIDFDLRSNPILAATEIMQSYYNFEKEAHSNLKALNDSFTMYLYNYTLLAQSIEKLNTGTYDKVEKHFDASMKFLSEHRGYDTSTGYNPKTFCYVTGTNLRSDFRTISAQATYHSKDGFAHAVDDRPHDIRFSAKDLYTGDVDGKVLISNVQLDKIKANYDRIYADDPNKESFSLYLGGQLEGERFLRDRLIIEWDGVTQYNDGYGVVLYSFMNLVNPGHSAQLMDKGHTYKISGTMDKSGFLNQFKAYSSEVYGKYYVTGKAYSLGSCGYVGKTCGCDNCLYAVGFFCKHVSAWSNDESALLTCEKDVPNTSHITERNGNDWTVGAETVYTVFILC